MINHKLSSYFPEPRFETAHPVYKSHEMSKEWAVGSKGKINQIRR